MALFRKSAKDLGIVKEKKRGASLQARKARTGWLFVLPFVLGFALIYIPIIYGSLKYSFNEIDILTGGGYELVWVGFGNYMKALGDSAFVDCRNRFCGAHHGICFQFYAIVKLW